MKRDNINYLLVGLFVITALLILLFMLYRITGQQVGASNYYVTFTNVEGVKDGTAVTYGGYQVGQVIDVQRLVQDQRTRYRMRLSINSEWTIPEDSVAQIVLPRLISEKQIEISEGYSATLLKPGEEIPSREAVDMMALVNSMGTELNKVIPNMAADFSRLMDNLNDSARQLSAILSEQNRNHMDNMFSNADQASAQLVKLAAGFDRVNVQLDQLLKRSSKLIEDNEGDIGHSVSELRRTMDAVSGNLQSILYNLNATSRQMNEFSRQLRNNPSILLGGKPPADQPQE